MRRYPFVALLLLFVLVIGSGAALGAGPAAQPAAAPTPVHYFDLTVSLEWQPGVDDLKQAGCSSGGTSDYLDDLQEGLRETAAYLYTYSAGQLALRKISIYTGGEQWDSADLRVLASSSYRPSAFVGGIVGAPTQNISATSGITRTVFYPATIFLGRLWSGHGSRCGAWSQPAGWRTIGHEWAHYALFLYDEYFNADTGAEQYCTTTGLDMHSMLSAPGGLHDSLMAYHYSADQLWLNGDPPSSTGAPPWSCKDTAQAKLNGETDWQTLKRFYPITVPARLSSDISFEGSPAASQLSIALASARTSVDTSADVQLDPKTDTQLIGEAYLLRTDANGGLQRIIGQGEIRSEDSTPLPFWGVQTSTKDRALIVAHDWLAKAQLSYPATVAEASALDVGSTNTVAPVKTLWQPSLRIVPLLVTSNGITRVIGLQILLIDCNHYTKRVEVVYCPAGGDCSTPRGMSGPDSSDQWSYTFAFEHPLSSSEPPALHGYIYVHNLETDEESAAWYQLGGGVGPATGEGHAPLADSEIETNLKPGAAMPSSTPDSQLLSSSAVSCDAGGTLPSGVIGLATRPLMVQPVVADGNGGYPWGSNKRIPDPPLRVRLSYSLDQLDRLGVRPTQLVVLRLNQDKGAWETVPTVAQSEALDWIEGEAQDFSGAGAVYALGYGRAYTWLPLLRR